jgi:hypothetical protein
MSFLGIQEAAITRIEHTKKPKLSLRLEDLASYGVLGEGE